MPSLKEIAWASLFITLTSAILMFAVAQLSDSGWADSVRAEAASRANHSGHSVTENGQSISPLIFVAMVGGSLLKIIFALGVPGLVTIGILRFTRRKRKQNRSSNAATQS